MIKIICVGKIKEKYLNDAIDEYTKRISKYTKLEIIEVKDSSYNEISKNLETEALSIEKNINTNDFIITLEIEGRNLTSEELAKKVEEISISYSNITYIIGGSYGLSENIKQKADLHLSFSKMTFPHQLFRVLLLEQIYRSYKINKNESYHK